MSRFAVSLFAIVALGCGGRMPDTSRPTVPQEDGGWRTLHARVRMHLVEETVRGEIDVERPDKLRIRGLRADGTTVFDATYQGGDRLAAVHLVGAATGRAIAEALAIAFDLEPRSPERTTSLQMRSNEQPFVGTGGDEKFAPPFSFSGEVTIRIPGHRVELSDFRAFGRKTVPMRLQLDGDRIELDEVAIDQPLPAATTR